MKLRKTQLKKTLGHVIFGYVSQIKGLVINVLLHNYAESILIYEKFESDSVKKLQKTIFESNLKFIASQRHARSFMLSASYGQVYEFRWKVCTFTATYTINKQNVGKKLCE